MADFACALWQEINKNEMPSAYPPAYIDAQTLTPAAHVEMQATAQRWIDSAVSKTANLPKNISFEDFKKVYDLAYASGCKGCTTYRPNEVTGSVLSVEPTFTNEEAELVIASAGNQIIPPALVERPHALTGVTYKTKLGSEPALYTTINDINVVDVVEYEPGVKGLGMATRPFEIFFNGKDRTHAAWAAALSRMISAIMRRGGDISFVVEELRAIDDPKGGGWIDGKYVPSMPAAIGDVIAKHLGLRQPVLKPLPDPVSGTEKFLEEYAAENPEPRPTGASCPICFSDDLYREEGCMKCAACGYSKCG